MLRFLLCSFYSFIYFFNGFCQIDPTIDTIFNNADKWYDEIQTMHYFYRAENQLGINPDTVKSYGNGYVKKIDSDSLGYKYNISNIKGKTKVIYDGKNLAKINDKYKTARIIAPYDKSVLGSYHDTKNVPVVFTKNYFADLKSDTSISSISLLSDTIIEGSVCYQVKVKYKPSSFFYSKNVHYFFNKDNYFCLGKRGFNNYAGFPRHHAYIIVFADVNVDMDENVFKHYKNIPSKYKKLKSYKPIKFTEPLKKNKKIPKFKGYTLDNSLITKEDLFDQITVLDFWYIGCAPCLKIVPTLDSLAINYKDKGVKVVGMNPFDTKDDIIKFKKFSQSSYDLLLIENKLPKKFNVIGYPTVFIINQEGRVAYSHIGPHQNLYQILSDQIDALITP